MVIPPILAALLAAGLSTAPASAAGTSGTPATDGHAIVTDPSEPHARLAADPSPRRPAGRHPTGDLLFVSRGMPKAELLAAIAAARQDPELTLVLRGILPGETLEDALRSWSALLGDDLPSPATVIDPTLYRAHGIEAVPILVDAATGRRRSARSVMATGRVPGAAPATPDVTQDGPTWPIAEPDLADLIRARADRLDVPARARAALDRFWRQVPALALPPAQADRVRRLRPLARTRNELRDHRGRVLLPPGAELNPLDRLPLTARILVIDAQDHHELAWARENRAGDRGTIHLIVNPDREGGWAAWQALQDALGAPAFLLDRHLAQRLGVEVTPSRIEAQGPELIVTETALPRLEQPQWRPGP